MSQTRKGSFAESLANVAIGYGVACVSQMIVFPMFGVECSTGKTFGIGAVFTVISIIRSYWVRRLFNAINWGNR